MSKLSFGKKKKLTRDLKDYANKCAYPRLPAQAQLIHGQNVNEGSLNVQSNQQNVNNASNGSSDHRQALRRSPRLNSGQNQNNYNNQQDNDNNINSCPELPNNQNQQDFHSTNNPRVQSRYQL
ncbi:transmembrane protein DDB_G0273707/DDB_G0273361-like [Protopterus annectens]|uniref:transmembrane protein DDB_G0273707/DDB_G0273361-like n=1 Tax=Protopterus annectens TaxID=7888 RepID=UPI001CFB7DEB|nr:transmembrane protein DDB_G0273707/DDB_G0273361-like [Protopterus annectens]